MRVANPFPVFLLLAAAFIGALATLLVAACGADYVLPAVGIAVVICGVIVWAATRGVERS